MPDYKLFPRLSGVAVENAVVAMQRLDPVTLKEKWAGKVEFDNKNFEDAIEYGDVGTAVKPEVIEAVAKKLDDCLRNNGGNLGEEPDDTIKVNVENAWARTLHSELPIAPSEAANPEVWHSFSCFYCPHLVSWRWGKYEQATPHFRWYSAEAANRQTFRRLWWRAELLKDNNAPSPYSMLEQMYEDELVGFTDQATISMHRSITLEVARQHLKNLDENSGSAWLDKEKLLLAPRTPFFRQFQKIVLRTAGQKDPSFIESTNQAEAFVLDCLNLTKKTFVHAPQRQRPIT
jgi:hypothetical protein